MSKDMVCIVCPRGCHLHIDDNLNVTGNFCPRGKRYAQSEVTNPVRIITSTVRINNRDNLVTSVKTSQAVSKDKIFDIMKTIDGISIAAPCKIGDIVVTNICDSGANLVVTKNIY